MVFRWPITVSLLRSRVGLDQISTLKPPAVKPCDPATPIVSHLFTKWQACVAASDRQRSLIDYSQRQVLNAPQRKEHTNFQWVSLCKNEKNHRNSPAHLIWLDQHFKDSSVKGTCGYCSSPAVFLLADPAWASRFPHIHRDLGEQVQLIHLHHAVGQRLDPVFVHCFSGVSDPVKPVTKHKQDDVHHSSLHSVSVRA